MYMPDVFHWDLPNTYTQPCYLARPKSISGFPCVSAGKESACNVGDLGSNPRLGRSPGEGKGDPIQYSCLRIPWTVFHGLQRVGHD